MVNNASKVRFTSTSRWKSKRSILCQLDPSSANTFQALLTCAHRHSDTTSRYERILPIVRTVIMLHVSRSDYSFEKKLTAPSRRKYNNDNNNNKIIITIIITTTTAMKIKENKKRGESFKQSRSTKKKKRKKEQLIQVLYVLRYLSSNSFGSFLLICASSSWNTHVSWNQKKKETDPNKFTSRQLWDRFVGDLAEDEIEPAVTRTRVSFSKDTTAFSRW